MDKLPVSKTHTFHNAMVQYRKYKNKKYDEDILEEIEWVRSKMLEHKIDQYEPWTMKILTDYLECRQVGLRYFGQRCKVIEALMKYGYDSLFWKELKRTKTQRVREWARVTYAVREFMKQRFEGGAKNKPYSQVLMRQAIDWRKKLLVNPLTSKMWGILWEAERELGIYFEDLTPEENGEVWRIRRKGRRIENG